MPRRLAAPRSAAFDPNRTSPINVAATQWLESGVNIQGATRH
jgi:hypothetical protein